MKNTEITNQDLATMLNIIDLVTKRGAFEGQEMLPVGLLREKIAQFLVNEKNKTAAEQEQLPSE